MSKNPKYIKIMSDLESQIKNNELSLVIKFQQKKTNVKCIMRLE